MWPLRRAMGRLMFCFTSDVFHAVRFSLYFCIYNPLRDLPQTIIVRVESPRTSALV